MNCFKHILAIGIAVCALFFFSNAYALVKIFEREYTYEASEVDSKASCRTITLQIVKRQLLEELGSYLVSETEIKDLKLTRDQVSAYSAGIVSTEVISEKWNGKSYWLKAKISADPDDIQNKVKDLIKDKEKTSELEDMKKRMDLASDEIIKLKVELANAKTSKEKKVKKVALKKATKTLTAREWFEKGFNAAKVGHNLDAVTYYTKAIELNPNFMYYYGRGLIYGSFLDDSEQAIKDMTDSIELNPLFRNAFYYRGIMYQISGKHELAINDFTQCLRLDLSFADQILNNNKLQHNNKAFRLRGASYLAMKNYQNAIQDFTIAIKNDNNDADSYQARGAAYGLIGAYEQAIVDHSKAIEIKPSALSYYSRSFSYHQFGNYEKSVDDLKMAARFGHQKAQDILTRNNVTW